MSATVTLAKTAGFCYGVDRAVTMLYDLVERGTPVCTLGPIIHNPQVIDDLRQRGVAILEKAEDALPGTQVVIRAHGVPKQVFDLLESRGVDYVDATCPYVLKIHRIVERHTTPDTVLLIAGDETHPEVRGIMSWVGTLTAFSLSASPSSVMVTSSTRSSSLERVLVSSCFCSIFFRSGVSVPESRKSDSPSSLTVTCFFSHRTIMAMYCV